MCKRRYHVSCIIKTVQKLHLQNGKLLCLRLKTDLTLIRTATLLSSQPRLPQIGRKSRGRRRYSLKFQIYELPSIINFFDNFHVFINSSYALGHQHDANLAIKSISKYHLSIIDTKPP